MAIPFRISPGTQVLQQKSSPTRDVRLWLGVALILGASIVGGKVFASASQRIPAVVVIHDLAAGTVVTAHDVQIMNVAIPTSVMSTSNLDEVIGSYVTQDVAEGSLLNPHVVSSQANSILRAISVPIKAGHLPNITYGARVDVWFTPSMEGAVAPGPATLLAANVVVQAVPEVFDTAIDTALTLQVTEDVVASIVQALRDGSVDIAVINGGTDG